MIDIENEMQSDIFRHFVVVGEEGSGKMSFLELLAEHFEHKSFN